MTTLDISAFKKVLASLFEVIEVYNKDKSNLITRDSMIQRFKYTYSLALKMIKRYFANGAFVFENLDGMTFNEMIRQANKMNLFQHLFFFRL